MGIREVVGFYFVIVYQLTYLPVYFFVSLFNIFALRSFSRQHIFRIIPLLPHLETAFLSEKFDAVLVGPKGDLLAADWLGAQEVRTAPSSPLTTTRGVLPFVPKPFDLKFNLL